MCCQATVIFITAHLPALVKCSCLQRKWKEKWWHKCNTLFLVPVVLWIANIPSLSSSVYYFIHILQAYTKNILIHSTHTIALKCYS